MRTYDDTLLLSQSYLSGTIGNDATYDLRIAAIFAMLNFLTIADLIDACYFSGLPGASRIAADAEITRETPITVLMTRLMLAGKFIISSLMSGDLH